MSSARHVGGMAAGTEVGARWDPLRDGHPSLWNTADGCRLEKTKWMGLWEVGFIHRLSALWGQGRGALYVKYNGWEE